MEPQLIGIGARHLERLVIALAGALAVWLGYRLFIVGALAVWLGYRLFINMPLSEKGTGKLQLPGGISIFEENLMTWHYHRGWAEAGDVQWAR